MPSKLSIIGLICAGCGLPKNTASDAASSSGDAPDVCASIGQLQSWQQEIDQFDGGYRPTGSPAHEAYISRLAEELTALGVPDVHLEPYSFVKWTPSSWSLKLLDGPAIALSGYVPYSGSTGPSGRTTGMVYVPASSLLLDPAAIEQALLDPDAWKQTLTARLQDVFAALQITGKIAVFDVPDVVVSLGALTGPQLLVNDPGGTLPIGKTVSRTDLSAMLIVPAMLDALAAVGAVGAVGILPLPEEAARAEYAPFFGVTTNLPAVYVDREHGETIKQAIASDPWVVSTMVLDATLTTATSENLIGVIPGSSKEEILIGSHTDGPNSMEDNGPVAILALASCVPPGPRTVRIVLSGGHFVGSRGLQSYVAEHAPALARNALAVMELEHLGAREWSEVSPGVMGLTGLPEMQLVSTWPNQPLVDASKAFASQFSRTIVASPPIIGEGQNFRVVPLIQFIAMPQYLLVGHLPAITTDFTDYDLMQRQVTAFRAMEVALANAPASQLGVIGN
ncbi:MAG TPA: hypothetical protein VF403_28390 [Kofleriaceae bacterium]